MNLMTGEAADELFGGEVPPTVHALLAQAREATRDEVPSLLWAAHACAPQCLAIYYLLYKCHAGRRQFELAERAARTGLAEAARQAGLAQDWRSVQPGPDFDGTGPARFWLFTLSSACAVGGPTMHVSCWRRSACWRPGAHGRRGDRVDAGGIDRWVKLSPNR